MIELVEHRAIAAFFGESPDMGLDDHGLLPRPSAPVRSAPSIGFMIDDFAGTENIIGLKCRCRIRHVDLVIDAEFVARARLHAGDVGCEPAALAALHRVRLLQHDFDAFRRRRPQPKPRAVVCQTRAEFPVIHAAPAKASTDRGGALVSEPDAKAAAVCAFVVFSTCWQFLYSAIRGNVKAISSGAAFSTIKIGACPCSIGAST